jgi:hypothetical protein
MRLVRGDDHQSLYMVHGRDLSIDQRCWLAQRFEARPLLTMPGRRCLIARQAGERPAHNVAKIGFDRGPPPAFWKPSAAICELCQTGAAIAHSGPCSSKRLRMVGSGILDTGPETILVSKRSRGLTGTPYAQDFCRAWTR